MSFDTSTRLDYLDAVRAFALILGIVFHASLSFMPIFIGWAVMDISTSHLVGIFGLISHSFRMELFFLIAGFFAHMTFHQKGMNSFVRSRFMRIAIPFVIGWFILRPLVVSAWVMGGESLRGDVHIWAGLSNGFASLASIPKDLFIGTHLWFLYYLLLISTGVVLLRNLISVSTPLQQFLRQFSDKAIAWLCHSRFAILLLAIPTACCLWFMQYWGVDTPDKSLIPNIPVFLLYAGFFLFGWLLHRQAALMEVFCCLSYRKVVVCLGAIIAVILLSKYEGQIGHPEYTLFKISYLLSYAIMMWSLVGLCIGVCKYLFKRSSKKIRYIADASYWLYLIHLPVVVWLQIAFAELPFHWTLKLLSICVITIVISLLMYDAFVRSTFIGATLNGKRRNRALFSRKVEPTKASFDSAQ
ncbi:acyltransferase family protein [Paraglaciecola sp. L3A3]|uniref:acyltransferase family protein n=1 Tax=Paraglaciecola sp. L3A3 TaxID=2686358 RepID=UPI00131E839D|nr:acyltransferase family protein [Paraglaciecola sp. L3A3]